RTKVRLNCCNVPGEVIWNCGLFTLRRLGEGGRIGRPEFISPFTLPNSLFLELGREDGEAGTGDLDVVGGNASAEGGDQLAGFSPGGDSALPAVFTGEG